MSTGNASTEETEDKQVLSLTENAVTQYRSAKMNYEEFNGIFFPVGTSPNLMSIISDAYYGGYRLRFCYGDLDTGKDYMESYDVVGCIGRSSGKIKVPLLIKTKRSTYGGELFYNIVKIEKQVGKKYYEIYRHKFYHTPIGN